jgi:hypothetical protein
MLLGVQVLLSLLVGLSVLAVINGVRAIVAPGQSTDRMQQFLGAAPGPLPTLQDLEMRASFFQRAIKPVGAALLQRLGQMAPQRNIEELHRREPGCARVPNQKPVFAHRSRIRHQFRLRRFYAA